MNALVIKAPQVWFLQETESVDVGWRVQCTDGVHDVMWGNMKSKRQLPALLADIEAKYGSVPTVIDETAEGDA